VQGSCSVFGAAPDDRSLTFRRDVAVVLDEDAFFPSLTLREHLAIIAAGHGVPDVEGAIDAELGFFGLAKQGDSLPNSLSSGQRRRLLLAAAFVRPRKLLVLDEPEQRLDTSMRQQLAARLRQEVAEGLGLLLVTHDPEFLLASATTALSISDTVQSLKPAQAAAAISATNPLAGQ
jgi:ABC-type multidrug transport system ATPase subunit